MTIMYIYILYMYISFFDVIVFARLLGTERRNAARCSGQSGRTPLPKSMPFNPRQYYDSEFLLHEPIIRSPNSDGITQSIHGI